MAGLSSFAREFTADRHSKSVSFHVGATGFVSFKSDPPAATPIAVTPTRDAAAALPDACPARRCALFFACFPMSQPKTPLVMNVGSATAALKVIHDGNIVDFITGRLMNDTPEEYVRQNVEMSRELEREFNTAT